MSSAKAARAAQKRKIRNAPLRSKAKTFINETRRSADDGEAENAEKAARLAVVALDKAAQKGAIHPKNAARRKSRLMKHLDRAKAS